MAHTHFTVTLVVAKDQAGGQRHALDEDQLFAKLDHALRGAGVTLEFGSVALGVSEVAKRYGFVEDDS